MVYSSNAERHHCNLHQGAISPDHLGKMFLPMYHCRSYNSILLALAFLHLTRAQLNLYSDGLFNDNDISSQCSTAITAEISCDPSLVALTSADSFGAVGDSALQESLCTTSCGTALSTYHDAVSKACAKDLQPWDGLPAVWAGDAVWATYNRTCLKDPNGGGYCGGEWPCVVQAFSLIRSVNK